MPFARNILQTMGIQAGILDPVARRFKKRTANVAFVSVKSMLKVVLFLVVLLRAGFSATTANPHYWRYCGNMPPE
jgi:hypothetical protein